VFKKQLAILILILFVGLTLRPQPASANPAPPASYERFCAWEGEHCAFSGTADVAYGAEGRFNYRSAVSGGTQCINEVFGDPNPGVRKACFIRPAVATPPAGYQFCAWEGEHCGFSGTADVAYGANGRFAYRNAVSSGIHCVNEVFGDPNPGVRKACFIRPAAAPPPADPRPAPPAGYERFCAWEGEHCAFSGTADVAYGANGRFAYRNAVSGGIHCVNEVFGDPNPGVRKACFIRPAAAPPPADPRPAPPADYERFCAWEGEHCGFSGTADVAYGANGRFAYRNAVSGGIHCVNEVFGDPNPGVRKACFIRPAVARPTPAPQPTPPPDGNSDNPIQVLSGDNNYFLKVDLRNPRVRIQVMLANNDAGGLQTLKGIKTRLENRGFAAWAIVNADLFSPNCPSRVNCNQGLTYIDGQHRPNWTRYGSTWPGRGNIGFDSNRNPEISVGDSQTRRHMVVAGGPRILMGGNPVCIAEYNHSVCGAKKTYFSHSGECFDDDKTKWCTEPTHITAVGYSSDGRYLYLGISRGGKNVIQLAQWLKDHGAHEVLRLDSGSSSGMYHNGRFMGGNADQRIASALAVIVTR
jgi:hypothetical protein